MTEDQRRDREVHGWVLAEGSVRAPDRLREAVRAELAETRQERFVSSVPAWLAAMPMRAAAAILVLVAGVGAVGFLVGRVPAGIGSPTAPPESPAPTPSASASPEPTPAGTLLPAGDAASQVFRPAVRFRVPAGSLLQADEPDLVSLVLPGAGWMRQGDGAVYFDSVSVYARPRAGQPDGTLPPVEGTGRTAEDLATWLSQRPQLTASTPILDSMAGRPAYRLDFELSPEAGDLCGIPCANLLDGTDSASSYRMGIEGQWKVRAWLLEAPDGSTIMVTVEDTDGSGLDADVGAAQPVLDSLSFEGR